MIRIGKKYKFDAAHSIPDHPKCGKVHGHTWTVEVEVEGEIPMGKTMLVDFNVLDEIVEPILEKLDHTNLNHNPIVVPTVEAIAQWLALSIYRAFEHRTMTQVVDVYVKVQEGDGGWAQASATK